MSDFRLKAIPTAALIWALHDRGLDVEYLVEQVSARPRQLAAKGDDPLVIPFTPRRKR